VIVQVTLKRDVPVCEHACGSEMPIMGQIVRSEAAASLLWLVQVTLKKCFMISCN